MTSEKEGTYFEKKNLFLVNNGADSAYTADIMFR